MKRELEDQHSVDYWSKAGTVPGRATITVRHWLKRRAWRFFIGGALLLKRALDVAVAAAAFAALSPLLALVVALIKVEDGGSIFFRQTRVGLRGRAFGMWKFRSMVVNADALKDQLQNEMAEGVTFKMKSDPRVTRIGKWIRKFSIDEMPQLWNVLHGEMSLVGPRPPVPREVAQYTIEERQRLLAKPGLTCFWQVGGRSEIDFAGQVRLDLEYIRSESIWLDVKLLFKTVPAVLLGKGAY
jgi:lipopolysaccharide/colanic/teichoic acid biosynthesis glycosyltransferase